MAETKDPFQALRGWLDRGERELNELLAERSSRPGANALRGRLADASLDAQKRFRTASEGYFHSINLPTRGDVIRLGKRIEEVERGLARIEALLRSGLRGEPAETPAAPSRPRIPRTRQPSEEVRAAESTRTADAR